MSNATSKKRGIIYIRVSGDDQKETGYSLPSQVRALREKMKKDGVEEVHQPIEDVESGRNNERKGIKLVIELAERKCYDFLYVYDLDRLGRHYAETPYLMFRLREHGVIVRDRTDEYDFEGESQSIKYVFVVMKCWQGHAESLKIGERTQRGKIEKFTQGKWVGPIPFGYRKNENGVLEKRSKLEPIILDLFQTYFDIKDYKKATQIINQKYAETIGNIPPFPFTTNRFTALTKNPVYKGLPHYGKTQIQADNLAIVSKDLWDKVQSLSDLRARKHKKIEDKSQPSLIDKLVSDYGLDYFMRVMGRFIQAVCPKCGSPMNSFGSEPHGNIRLPNYRCTNKKCTYQRNIPSISELKEFRENKISCPVCRAIEDFIKIETLVGSMDYRCRRCGTLFRIKTTNIFKTITKTEPGKNPNPKPSDHRGEELNDFCNPLAPSEKMNTSAKKEKPGSKRSLKSRENSAPGRIKVGNGTTLADFSPKPAENGFRNPSKSSGMED
jgi:DNA invertase Pin-like site-specific DNA recombinase